MSIKPKVLILIPIALATVALSGCEFFVQTVAPTPTLVSAPPSQLQRPMVAVERGTLEEAVRMTGRVEANERSDLFFKAPGRIKVVNVRQGDEILAGEILAELETGGLESQLADAEKTLETAELRFKAADSGVAEEIQSAKEAVQIAEFDVIAKELALEKSKTGPTESQFASARATLIAAEATVESRQADIDAMAADHPRNIASAQATVEQRLLDLQAANDALRELLEDGAPAESPLIDQSESAIITLEAAIDSQQSVVYQVESDLNDLKNKPTPSQRLEADTAFEKAKLAHDAVMGGDGSLESKHQAQIVFREATRAYNDALAPSSEAELRVAGNRVETEKARLLALQVQLRELLGEDEREIAVRRSANEARSAYDIRVEAAERSVRKAQLALQTAQINLEKVLSTTAMDNAKISLESSRANVTRARTALEELNEGPDSQNIEIAENHLTVSRARLESAVRRLETLESGESASAINLTILRNARDQAQIRFDRLKEQQFENQIIAPFDGEITFVRGRPGDQIAAYQEIIGLANPSILVVEAVVPDVDQAKLAVGQIVDVTIDQFAGVVFVGKVDALPRTIVSSTGQAIRIPETKVLVDWTQQGVELGMLARLKIAVQVKENVLKIPRSAVRTVNQRQFVETVIGEQRRSLPVTTGINSDTEIEILDGLEEGMMVFSTP
ncbi:MAG: HlyD family efflux transporter periplasmic adaptor subunit [Chloroflexi bacterium]|nr:HlyD family efflux transporter periplasmic adaptor subunit [Chloroflexota bacterium]MCY3937582.1 HlyD family efflux transporter periplasmic adaptor subunit [Chloroflexota bacterium]